MESGWKLASVLLMLAGMGTAYNWAVARLERSSIHRYVNTALLVIFGTGFTLAGAAIVIGLEPALLVVACFAASGLPMFLGSYIRQVKGHERDEKQYREYLKELANHDKAKAKRVLDA